MKSKAFYWVVVVVCVGLLIWGWSIALTNLVNGTSVVS